MLCWTELPWIVRSASGWGSWDRRVIACVEFPERRHPTVLKEVFERVRCMKIMVPREQMGNTFYAEVSQADRAVVDARTASTVISTKVLRKIA